MNKQTIITALLALVALSGQAQEIRMNEPAWYLTCNNRMNNAFSISLYAQYPFSQHPLTNKTEVMSHYVQKEISQRSRDYGNMLTLKLGCLWINLSSGVHDRWRSRRSAG